MLSAFAPAKIASETFLSTMGLSYTRYTLLLVFAASLILESHARLKGESPFSPPGELSLSLEELPVRELRRTKPERNDNRKVPKNAEGPWKKPKIPKAEKTAGKVSKMENARNNDDVKKPKEDKAVPAQQSSKFPKSTERAKTKPRSDDEKESSSTEASSNKAANGEYGPPSEKDGDGHREKATKEGKPEKTKKDEKDDHEKKTVKSGRDKADEEEKLEKSNKDNEKQAVKTKKAKTENEGKGGEESGEREKKEGSAQKQPRKKTEEDEEDLPDDFEAPVEGNAFENPFGKIDKPTDTDPQSELSKLLRVRETVDPCSPSY